MQKLNSNPAENSASFKGGMPQAVPEYESSSNSTPDSSNKEGKLDSELGDVIDDLE